MGKLKMKFEKLGVNNVNSYLLYLKEAFSMESHMMVGEKYDEDGIRKRITDPFYMKTTSILVMTDCGNVIGRLEYHFYGCMCKSFRNIWR